MATLRETIVELVTQYQPVSVRQVFYLLVDEKLIRKTEGEYNKTVDRLLVELREDGTIPWEWIVDYSRVVREPTTFGGVGEALTWLAQRFRLKLWDELPVRVEIFCEKDTVLGSVLPVTQRWGVPLMVTHGHSGNGFLHLTSDHMLAINKATYIYQIGDHDPAGADIVRHLEEKRRRYAPGAEIHIERLAVTPAQIVQWNLPTRPNKPGDTRSKKFPGESVEVDAVEPTVLAQLVEAAITRHVDPDILTQVRAEEAEGRTRLARLAALVEGEEES